MNSIDKIGVDTREPTVTEDDLNEYNPEQDDDYNLTDHKEVAITYQGGVYGSDRTLNGEVVETITDEDLISILSVDEEANEPSQVTPAVAGRKFAAWDMDYLVGQDGSLQPRYGQSSNAVDGNSTSELDQKIDVIE